MNLRQTNESPLQAALPEGGVHLGRLLVREEGLQHKHLTKTDEKDCNCDKNTPDHYSLVQVLRPLTTLSFPESMMGLKIYDRVEVLMDLTGRGLHLCQ